MQTGFFTILPPTQNYLVILPDAEPEAEPDAPPVLLELEPVPGLCTEGVELPVFVFTEPLRPKMLEPKNSKANNTMSTAMIAQIPAPDPVSRST